MVMDSEYTLSVKLAQVNPKAHPKRAYAPRFQKPLPEGYWLVLGHVRELALGAISYLL